MIYCVLFTGVFLDSPTEFTVDAKSVSPQGEGNVRAIVNNPSGVKNDTTVTNKGDGTYDVLYTPVEEGRGTRKCSTKHLKSCNLIDLNQEWMGGGSVLT